MSYIGSTEWYQKVQAGDVAGHSIVHKFGYGNVGTTMEPLTLSGFYRTPTTATALEILSSDADDTSTGTGARKVTVIGLNSSWAEVSQEATMNGTTAVALSTDLIRVYRMFVSESGFYGTVVANGANEGTLTLRESGGGDTWAQIGTTPVSHGQTLIGCYTIPTAKTGHVLGYNVGIDSTKSVDFLAQAREGADDVSLPFSGSFRTLTYQIGLTGSVPIEPRSPSVGFVGPTDIACFAKVAASTADVSIDFEILLIG